MSGMGRCGAAQRVNVVVHEPAHLKVHSHGREFWAYLATLLPGYERPKSWLDTRQGALDAEFLDAARLSAH